MLKFHGKFRDLIPAGWTFQKLFANNYRQYHKEIVPGFYFRVWQHHGGYVEFDDWHSQSESIAKAALDDEKYPWKDHCLNWPNGTKSEWTDKMFALNLNTGELVNWDNMVHDPVFKIAGMEKEGASQEEIDKVCEDLYNTYRRIGIAKEIVEGIKNLIDRGWIKLDN